MSASGFLLAGIWEGGGFHLPLCVRCVLTPREREIVRAVACGESNKEIAARLGTSPHTVKNQLTALYRKTGAANRIRLIAWAYHEGHTIFDE